MEDVVLPVDMAVWTGLTVVEKCFEGIRCEFCCCAATGGTAGLPLAGGKREAEWLEK